jgi:signal transduction histidine kinase/streptogramin lyase
MTFVQSHLISLRAALLAVTVLLPIAAASAAHEVREITDYSITGWSLKDGLPSSVVWALAQDVSGYLWLGTDGGLVRFDGVRFSAWSDIGREPLPKQLVQALYATSDNTLWVGYGEADGGITRIKDGRIRNYGSTDGLSRGPISTITQDSQGTLWASGTSGVYWLAGDRWQLLKAPGLDLKPLPRKLFFSQAGDLIVVVPSTIYRRKQGQEAFESIQLSPGFRPRSIGQDSSGALWLTDSITGVTNFAGKARHSGRGAGSALLADERGQLWVGTFGQGLWRIKHTGPVNRLTIDKATTRNGLANDVVLALLQDRDGNIWVGTNEGINRLIPHNVVPVVDVGHVTALAATPEGDLWVGNGTRELIRFSTGKGEWHRQQIIFARSSTLRVLHVDHAGHLWMAGNRELARLDPRTRQPVRWGPRHTPFDRIRFLTSNTGGDVWVSDGEALYVWSNGRWNTFAAPDDVAGSAVTSVYGDSAGRIWIGFDNGSLLVVGETTQIYRPDDLGRDSRVFAFFEDERHDMWLGGFGWVGRSSNGRFDAVSTLHNAFPAGYVKAIAAVGPELWIGSDPGIVRFTIAAFDEATAKPGQPLVFRLYDTSDGLAGSPIFTESRNAPQTIDGMLWFATGKGLTAVDTHAEPPKPARGPVQIESIVADGRKLDTLQQVSLAPRTTTVEIAYTAVHLAAPHTLRFRYRLEGFDSNWSNAGARRTAYFTNLPPRNYRFEVMVQDEDGSWRDRQSIDFTVRPMFYQSSMFFALCVATAAAAGWGLWKLRLLRLRRELSLLFRERLRLSREVHDTLLQSLVGVSLQLKALSRAVEAAPAIDQSRFARLQTLVEEHIRETRRSIGSLRSPLLQEKDLCASLRLVGENATMDSGVSFHCSTTGTPTRVSPHTEGQLLRIGQEAIYNAVRHAAARSVHVRLEYTRRSLLLTVTDDGQGFATEQPADTRRPHYGLSSMKERAEGVGGSFRLTSSHGNGTNIEVVIPL